MREDGQASVELVALLPLLVVVAAIAWQAVVTGHAVWRAGHAAAIAARTVAVGGDADAAARAALPRALRDGLEVRIDGARTTVRVRVPAVIGGWRLGTVTRRAGFPPQSS